VRTAALLLLAAAGLSGAGAAAAPAAPPPRPSLLLVTFDTTRADRIGCYGAKDASTPALDALAKRGVRFAEALSPAPLTLPSHATILTGRAPREHGARDNEGYRLADAQVSLAETLQGAGFATAAFVGAAVLDRVTGIGQGFAHFDDQVRVGSERWFAWQERAAQQVVDATEARLATLKPPFFLWVHFYDPHLPYVPPEPYATRFAKRPYDGEIAYADAQLGRLLERLAARGLDRSLVVAVAGDHGESLGEHGEAAHDVFVYQATQRVPLILAGPGIAAGRVVEERVGLIDLAPTLAELLGLPFPEARGRSLVPWVRPTAPPPRPREAAIYEIESVFPARAYGWAPLFGAVQGTLKFVDAPRPELYDLARDPRETTNLLDAAPRDDAARRALEAGRPLAARVRELFAADIEALSAGGDAAGAAAVDPEHRARLEALGYAGGSASRPGDPRIDPKDGMTFLPDLDQARERLQRGDPKQAGLLATRLLARNPQNLPARLVLAQAQLGQGDAAAALATLDEAIARAPDDPLPRFQRGNALRMRGRGDPAALDAAAVAYREALARHPRHAPSVYALASLLVERGDLAGASALLDDAERRGVADGALLTLRGAAEAARGQSGAADAALARALALDPTAAAALEGRGKLAYARGDARAAAGFYRQALALAPSAVLARTLGAILWFDLKDAAGARAALQQALALDPAGPDADDVRALLAEIR
jgi:arylsulfatase A-like enzyme/Tfp pilus assembly protein PilF